jgi:lipopolysaccharide/colanic/teichoic acid biosynthesis glycosyltransferase
MNSDNSGFLSQTIPHRTSLAENPGFAAWQSMPHRAIPFPPPPMAPASPWSISAAKRLLDLGSALLALVLLAPLILLVALLVAFSSPGPVLFTQKRVGRLGRLFTIYKFRTMEVRADGPSHTRSGDPRITPVGRFLRKYKLDELPQLYNVLVGDMSVVGPRPKLPHHEALHMPFRPGLTGAATLAFRQEEEMLRHIPDHELEHYYAEKIKPVKVQLDCDYMEQSSFRSDVAMVLYTLTACLLPANRQIMIDLTTIV